MEGNPSPVYEVQRGMISYNWGGLEGQGSGESAVHIEPICNTHFNQTCDPPRPERKGKKLLNYRCISALIIINGKIHPPT